MDFSPPSERLASGVWFNRIGAVFRDGLLSRGMIRTAASGTTLFHREDPSDGLYAVLDGAIEISGFDAAGQLAILAMLEAPMWFGEVAVLDGLPRSHDARAVRASTLFHVTSRDVFAILEMNPYFWRELAWLTTTKLRLAFKMTEVSAFSGADRKLVSHLLMIMRRYDQADAARSRIRISQQQLAGMLSMSRQTVNRILKKLEAENYLALGNGRIDLLDIDQLIAMTK